MRRNLPYARIQLKRGDFGTWEYAGYDIWHGAPQEWVVCTPRGKIKLFPTLSEAREWVAVQTIGPKQYQPAPPVPPVVVPPEPPKAKTGLCVVYAPPHTMLAEVIRTFGQPISATPHPKGGV